MVTRLVDLRGLTLRPEQRREAVEEIRAGGEAGFFHVKNFGVSEATMGRLRRLSREYYTKAVEEELLNQSYPGPRKVGYSAKFTTAAEPIQQHRMMIRSSIYPEEKRKTVKWPSDELRDVAIEYNEGVYRASCYIAGLLSEALGMPSSYVLDSMGKEANVQALLSCYPTKTVAPRTAENLTLGAHTDLSVLNVPLHNFQGGLQFFVEGEYVDIPIVDPYALCVNIGDALETISNGRFFSATHRVKISSEDRLAFATIFDAQPDVVLEPDSSLISEEYPAHYYRARTMQERADMFQSPDYGLSDLCKLYIFQKPEYLDKSKNLHPVSEGRVLAIGNGTVAV